jgi:hypothetical protein
MDSKAALRSVANGQPSHRIAALKRAFQREFGRKPTCLQQTLIDRACVLTARSELVAVDPVCSATDVVRLDNAAARARQAAFDAIAAARRDDEPLPTLQQLLEGAA